MFCWCEALAVVVCSARCGKLGNYLVKLGFEP